MINIKKIKSLTTFNFPWNIHICLDDFSKLISAFFPLHQPQARFVERKFIVKVKTIIFEMNLEKKIKTLEVWPLH